MSNGDQDTGIAITKEAEFWRFIIIREKIIILIFLKKSKNYFCRTVGTKAHLKIKVLGSELIFVIFIVSETLVASIKIINVKR